MHWKGVVRHLRDEAEVKATAVQEKHDGLLARLLEAKEKLKVAEAVSLGTSSSKRIAEEHAEYEEVIRRAGGLTISEAEARIVEIVRRCHEYGTRYGKDSWQLREQKEELRKVGSLYKTLSDREPRLRRFLASNTEAVAVPGSSRNSPRRTTIVRSMDPDFYRRERELQRRGRGQMQGRGRSSSSSAGRVRGLASGRGRGSLSIDDLLGGDFSDKWFNRSPRPPDASS